MDNKIEITDREKWFIERVGKVIWRNKTNCPCSVCEDVYNNGLYLMDEGHASYVFCTESEYDVFLKYFETKEERDIYEKELNFSN